MTFSDIYSDEVYEARRDRAKRARFWAKVVSLMLVLTIGATLRSEPNLRLALMTAGMDGVLAVAGGAASDTGSGQPFDTPAFMAKMMQRAQDQAQRQARIDEAQPQIAQATGSKNKVKVNRHSFGQDNGLGFTNPLANPAGSGSGFSRGAKMADTKDLAEQLGKSMEGMNVGN
ncbi:hypothetical protein Z946_772 [Sulfitobacter noctilucicola]|uniref:Uncharacterized protein n=1 Tax=Sulfitobacter noctilucicola TaxID=1342301 RepID=A0A7W6M7L7_9RHOB|nr:hypothetical protein [Sulfitobacter noctilucicola]KIN61916.1 hypothetical protein Z946_772 [Sulfitobacter noctilucicola]MBB4173562.1 hypothetical protein [Sulfitobacter noctilucicola]